MTQYIDKSALVAEIEKLKSEALQKKSQCKRHGLERIVHKISAYNKILSIIDTLEVKEVQEPTAVDRCMAEEIIINPQTKQGELLK
jgi:archaellum biogenesis ATPase FlaH